MLLTLTWRSSGESEGSDECGVLSTPRVTAIKVNIAV